MFTYIYILCCTYKIFVHTCINTIAWNTNIHLIFNTAISAFSRRWREILIPREWKTAGPCFRHRFPVVSSERKKDCEKRGQVLASTATSMGCKMSGERRRKVTLTCDLHAMKFMRVPQKLYFFSLPFLNGNSFEN